MGFDCFRVIVGIRLNSIVVLLITLDTLAVWRQPPWYQMT